MKDVGSGTIPLITRSNETNSEANKKSRSLPHFATSKHHSYLPQDLAKNSDTNINCRLSYTISSITTCKKYPKKREFYLVFGLFMSLW